MDSSKWKGYRNNDTVQLVITNYNDMHPVLFHGKTNSQKFIRVTTVVL